MVRVTQPIRTPAAARTQSRVRTPTHVQENAGFKLLMKLGYKGGGLGKDGAGTTKPLMPELKQGRAG